MKSRVLFDDVGDAPNVGQENAGAEISASHSWQRIRLAFHSTRIAIYRLCFKGSPCDDCRKKIDWMNLTVYIWRRFQTLIENTKNELIYLEGKQHDDNRQGGLNGFILTLKVFLPLSIVSYFNESVNGYFCMWGPCGTPPPYYHLPRLAALGYTIFIIMFAWGNRGDSETHKGSFAWGVFIGVIIGSLMFIILSAIGWIQG